MNVVHVLCFLFVIFLIHQNKATASSQNLFWEVEESEGCIISEDEVKNLLFKE